MCVFSAVIKPASENIIRRGGVMKTEISKQDAIKYLERKSSPGWDADDSLYSEPMQSTGLFDKNGQEIFEGKR